MTLARAIVKALSGAEILRQKATVPFMPTAEAALLIEQSKAIEHVCSVASQHLQPESAGRIAEAMLMPAGHMRDHAAQLMDATIAAMALPKRGGTES